MVNMAETESMFLGGGRLSTMNGGADTLSEDSDLDAAPMLMPLYSENHHHHHHHHHQTKRNKRKNFQPRNITYCEESMAGDDDVPTGPGEYAALDLSSSEPKRPRTISSSTGPDSSSIAAPMDLSSKPASTGKPDTEDDTDEGASSEDGDGDSSERSLAHSHRQFLLQQAFLHHHQQQAGPDASDLRDFAQNTVKELLEIYGLNSAEVAESITNNVPIANFSSGKILESLRQGQSALPSHHHSSSSKSIAAADLVIRNVSERTSSPATDSSQPPTPPRSPPQSPVSFKSFKDCWSSAGSTIITNSTPTTTTSASSFSTNDHSGPTNGGGSPNKFPSRMVLPQNMATILALAAIQDRQSSNSCSPTVPSTSNPKDLSSTIVLGRDQGSPSVRDGKTIAPIDYSRYVRRFSGSLECGNQYCKELNYREHFHCLDCNSRVFVKKEEMIRHFKWHKKRDESLQHGFMRYSPSDDCSERYPHCGHNRKQTHYHCIQGTCDKVYISTSDVQMHANYHRKDSAIIQEGFQRLRATEECRTPYCAFYGQRTTHFHCRRDQCQFTFKNKADMEKHKTYHIKDEQLARDGFKKFLKPDPCGFPNCRFSTMSNHIHCVRDGCSYVLHSSGQLLSHKRKHERKDSEIAYRKFKLAQQAVVNIGNSSDHPHPDLPPGTSLLLHQASSLAALNALSENLHASQISGGRVSPKLSNSFQYKNEPGTPPSFLDQSTSSQQSFDYSDDEFTRYIAFYGANQICQPQCPFSNSDHYHCREIACEHPFRCRETAEGHARMHDAQERVSDFFQDSGSHCPGNCPKEKHYHCTWEGCSDIVMPSERLEHFRSHEISAQHNNSLESLFRRKRGRPPKNRVIEVWNDYASGGSSDSPQAIFTSFKLPKPNPSGTSSQLTENSSTPLTITSPLTITPVTEPPKTPTSNLEALGFQSYNGPCPDPLCSLSVKALHYHCSRLRCFFATDSEEFLVAHARDFHDNIDILDGFIFFDRSVDCRIESCPSNKVNRHFHCIKPGCGFSFVRYSHMAIHKTEHENESNVQQNSPSSQHQPTDLSESSDKTSARAESPKVKSEYEDPAMSNSRPTVVKASGTFYPLCGLSNSNSSPTPPSDVQVKSEGTGGTASQQSMGQESGATLPSTQPASQVHSMVTEWMSVDKHERFGDEAFSDTERPKPRVAKHSPSTMSPVVPKQESNNNEENSQSRHEVNILAPPHPPALSLDPQDATLMPPPWRRDFSAAMAAAVANQQLAMITSQGIPFMPHAMPGLYTSPSGLMFAGPPGFAPHHSALVNNGLLESARASMLCSDTTPESLLSRNSLSPQRDMSQEAKKARIQSSMRMLKDEPVPEGYLRYRFNEDCRYQTCGYREHQTHFHCMRQDCGYSFCDKTRFVQHTARHERLDTLMGGDFRQYRSNMSCGRPDCTYTPTIGSQNKSSHFHCIKCEFVCTDTNKVVAHRRLHQKLASIYDAGFEKFTPTQPCSAPDTCVHNGKQTHYHCLNCQYAVLGLSQMTAHKYRHE